MRAIEFLARPEGSFAALDRLGVVTPLPAEWAEALSTRVRYRGYIERQQRTAERAASLDGMPLTPAIWDDALSGLSREAREKLQRMRPATLGQASRIAGVSPSDIAVLMVHARKLGAVIRVVPAR